MVTILARIRAVIRTVFRREALNSDLDDELDSYVELLAEEKVRAGLEIDEARRLARAELGGREQVKARVRERRRGAWLETVLRDIAFALRQFRRNPGFAVTAVLTMGIGIGATASVFGIVKTVLVAPLPYPSPGELVTLWSEEDWGYGTNVAEYLDIRERQSSLSDIAVYTMVGANMTTPAGDPRRGRVAAVTGGFFGILGIEALHGRAFGNEEDAPGANRVAVLQHSFWTVAFGADPSVVGTSIFLDGAPYTIVGIMPAGFTFPDETRAAWSPGGEATDVWVPIGVDPARPGGRGGHGLPSVARLAPGVSIDQASEDIRRVSLAMHREHPDSYPQSFRAGWTLRLEPLGRAVVGDVRTALLILSSAVGLVLVIACGNVANLLLSRGRARGPELAMRRFLGAGRWRVVRQLLTESTVLTLVGGAAGITTALGALPLLLRMAPPDMPGLDRIGVHGGGLAFAVGVSVVTGLLVGLVPALRVADEGSAPAGRRIGLKGRPHRAGVRSSLIAVQVAMTAILLVGAGLLIRSLSNLRSVDPGYRVENVLTSRLTLPASDYPSASDRLRFFEGLLERLGSQPGVLGAGAITELPLARDFSAAIMAEGMPVNQEGLAHGVVGLSAPRSVTPGYFEAMDLSVVGGRPLRDTDQAGGVPVAVVSDEFAATAWPDETPLGKRIAFATRGTPAWFTVVGVVRDTREEAGKLASERYRDVYIPLAQRPSRDMYMVLRVDGAPDGFAPILRREVATVDPNLPIHELRPMTELVRRATAGSDFNARLMSLFGLIALGLAAVGVYGVTSYTVGRRRRELGIRLALGASPWRVLSVVVANGLMPVAVGMAVGLPGAFALSRVLESLLFGVGAAHPATYAIACATILAIGCLACWMPARSALREDPLTSLREE